ncbi:MAG: hypothetical protein ACI3ZG_00240 [Candidatus Coprenecus sp.]
MKTKLMILLVAATMFVACGDNNSKKAADNAAEATEATTSMEIDAVLTEAEALTDQQIVLEGICTHICKHGGTKIFMMGSDDTKTLRIEAAKLGSFDQKCVNSIVKVNGILREERVDEAYLQRWEAAVAAQTAKQHGEVETGCDSEKAARGETGNTVAERIADFRTKIAARKAAVGKEYLSFYYVEALSYEIVE